MAAHRNITIETQIHEVQYYYIYIAMRYYFYIFQIEFEVGSSLIPYVLGYIGLTSPSPPMY
jgi:hypothetical protein